MPILDVPYPLLKLLRQFARVVAHRMLYTSVFIYLYHTAEGPHKAFLKEKFFQFAVVCFQSHWVPYPVAFQQLLLCSILRSNDF